MKSPSIALFITARKEKKDRQKYTTINKYLEGEEKNNN